ncbi:MAG: hypothetical protein AB1734_06185 [Elusimicrobiota bacterium]
MAEHLIHSTNVFAGEWIDSLPDICDSSGNMMLRLSEFNPPVKGLVCVDCKWFSLASVDSIKGVPKNDNVNICSQCGKDLQFGYWSSMLPTFKKKGHRGFLVISLIGNAKRIGVRFCPSCLYFFNVDSEFEYIANAEDISDVRSYFDAKIKKNRLFNHYVVKRATMVGIFVFAMTFIYFWAKPSEYPVYQKILIISIISIVFMGVGMVFGSLIGMIESKIKSRSLR